MIDGRTDEERTGMEMDKAVDAWLSGCPPGAYTSSVLATCVPGGAFGPQPSCSFDTPWHSGHCLPLQLWRPRLLVWGTSVPLGKTHQQ